MIFLLPSSTAFKSVRLLRLHRFHRRQIQKKSFPFSIPARFCSIVDNVFPFLHLLALSVSQSQVLNAVLFTPILASSMTPLTLPSATSLPISVQFPPQILTLDFTKSKDATRIILTLDLNKSESDNMCYYSKRRYASFLILDHKVIKRNAL